MAYKLEGLEGYTRRYWQGRLHNPYANFRPFMYFLGLRSVEALTKLGRPRTPAVFGDISSLGLGERDSLTHSTEIYWSYQKTEPSDGTQIEHRGTTPTASTFAEDNLGQIAMKWTHFVEPVRIGQHSLDDASGPSAVMSIMDNANRITWEALMKRINDQLWSGTRTLAQQQNQRQWTELLGIDHVATEDNAYGQVDRSVETNLNPLTIDATTDLDRTAVELSVCDVINDGNANVTGRAAKSPDGMGCNLHIVHPTLFHELRKEAKGGYVIHTNGIPNHPFGGARFPVIEYGNNWIIYDSNSVSTEWTALRLESWLLEVDARYNFRPQAFRLASENEEGGGHHVWSNIHARVRLSCREPWLQARVTGLTAK